MSRILKTGSNQITNTYANHNGWSKGIDIVKYRSKVDDIVAHTNGMVIKVVNYMKGKGTLDNEGMGYGNYIMILHKDTYNTKFVVTLYAHLDSIDNKIIEGVHVTAGQIIGKMGSTGNSYGAHLHFEVRLYNTSPQGYLHDVNKFEWTDPTPYIDSDLPKNVEITGFLDTADYNKSYIFASGWGYQGTDKNPVEIKIYKNSKIQAVIETPANKSRPDVKAAMSYNTDKVGFVLNQYYKLDDGVYEVKAFLDDVQLTNTKSITVKNELAANSYNNYPTNSNQYYRIRKTFNDPKSSLGSYENWSNAFRRWKIAKKQGYHIYDNNGKQLD